jgi:hypothetical protein
MDWEQDLAELEQGQRAVGYEESKLLGGDAKTTHLVHGLDVALARRMRAEEARALAARAGGASKKHERPAPFLDGTVARALAARTVESARDAEAGWEGRGRWEGAQGTTYEFSTDWQDTDAADDPTVVRGVGGWSGHSEPDGVRGVVDDVGADVWNRIAVAVCSAQGRPAPTLRVAPVLPPSLPSPGVASSPTAPSAAARDEAGRGARAEEGREGGGGGEHDADDDDDDDIFKGVGTDYGVKDAVRESAGEPKRSALEEAMRAELEAEREDQVEGTVEDVFDDADWEYGLGEGRERRTLAGVERAEAANRERDRAKGKKRERDWSEEGRLKGDWKRIEKVLEEKHGMKLSDSKRPRSDPADQ